MLGPLSPVLLQFVPLRNISEHSRALSRLEVLGAGLLEERLRFSPVSQSAYLFHHWNAGALTSS